jgi:hypothetical protein
MMKHRWKWTDKSVECFPPVKACEPNVSRAVDPPSTTHQPVCDKKKKSDVGSYVH